MSFKKLPDNLGLIYIPDGDAGKNKHPCPDCFSCQWCGNERCRLCMEKSRKKQKRRNPGRNKK